ncbi:charged multivesicular body protein 4b-like [Amphiura filiformis]|uniref:charged multivesicular body protein 4b-like n=1 Tax=Amphiura filiformis TaxID=82378 RepID=UPI003B2110D3
MADIHEQMELADEISTAISQPTCFGQDIDEDELEELELEELQPGTPEVELLEIGPAVTGELPEVPTEEPVKPKKVASEDDMVI